MRIWGIVALILISILNYTPAAQAAENAPAKEIIAEGKYQMGDNDTPSVAAERALLNAKRNALEQAGTYMTTFTQVKDFITVDDNVTALSAGVMEVTVLERKRTQIGDGMEFWVKIKALIHTDKLSEAMGTGLSNDIMGKSRKTGEKNKIAVFVTFRSVPYGTHTSYLAPKTNWSPARR